MPLIRYQLPIFWEGIKMLEEKVEQKRSTNEVRMIANRTWLSYPPSYRAREMKRLAGWISSWESGSVVGLPGIGRSNLLGFLCYRPEVIQNYLPPQANSVILISVDLNNLPANNLATLYRVILRAFYRVCGQFDQTLQQNITTIYQENRTEQDPFLTQSALQELLLLCQAQRKQVVLVMNRFDIFCQMATPPMVNTLRGLRDDFKDTLCYIAGMTQEVAYLPDSTVLGHMYELLDNYICWVGAMNGNDAQSLIDRATCTAPRPPTKVEVAAMLSLTGAYPALLRATCHWWRNTEQKPAPTEWEASLLAERSIQHRLKKIWDGLTQEEQFVVSELQKLQGVAVSDEANGNQATKKKSKKPGKGLRDFAKQHQDILNRLAIKGICWQTETGWQIAADLIVTYIAQVEGRGRGRIWLDEKTGEIYQGQTLLENLTSLEGSVLSYLIKHPRIKHTKTELIINTWADELRQEGVSDNSLYQVILVIRKAIEPDPSEPSYLITWRGKPEGGYQFFPEGRPK